MAKRNVSYIKPEDPDFLRRLKKQAGYDDRNHKFDELQNDFDDDNDTEQPQIVVLKPGDLTEEEANNERKRIEDEEKKDLTKVCFIPKKTTNITDSKKRKQTDDTTKKKVKKPMLSFDLEDEENSS